MFARVGGRSAPPPPNASSSDFTIYRTFNNVGLLLNLDKKNFYLYRTQKKQCSVYWGNIVGEISPTAIQGGGLGQEDEERGESAHYCAEPSLTVDKILRLMVIWCGH